MASSNILGGDPAPARPPGHGTADLGPSDSSDSGSDLAGAAGTAADAGLDADSGTTSDIDRALGAGPDLGDTDLDADSDAGGTGERRAAGRDSSAPAAADIAPDRLTRDPGGLTAGDDPEGIGVSGEAAQRR